MSIFFKKISILLGAARISRRAGGERPGAAADVPRVRRGVGLRRLRARAGAALGPVPRLQAVPVPDRYARNR